VSIVVIVERTPWRDIMKATTLATLAILITLLSAGCATTTAHVRHTPPTPDSPAATSVPALDDHNVIFPAERAPDLFGGYAQAVDGYWTPSEDQIRGLRAQLPPYLFDATPPERTRPRGTDAYFAQFVGITRDGQPLIHANFFCDDFGMDWRSDLMIVCDGGSCFFSVEYDPATGVYQNLMINGEA
jgi:hypothetical protein